MFEAGVEEGGRASQGVTGRRLLAGILGSRSGAVVEVSRFRAARPTALWRNLFVA